MRVRAGLINALYNKALVLSSDERNRSSGDIINLMSVDTTRLQDFCTYGLIAISGPFQVYKPGLINLLHILITYLVDILSIYFSLSIARMASLRRSCNHGCLGPTERIYC